MGAQAEQRTHRSVLYEANVRHGASGILGANNGGANEGTVLHAGRRRLSKRQRGKGRAEHGPRALRVVVCGMRNSAISSDRPLPSAIL